MEEFEKAMNPVTHLLSNLSSVVNFLHDIIMQVFNELVDALKLLMVLIGEILQSIQPLVSEVIHTITGAIKDLLSFLAPLIGIVKMLAPVFQGLA
jgi:phage-related protein